MPRTDTKNSVHSPIKSSNDFLIWSIKKTRPRGLEVRCDCAVGCDLICVFFFLVLRKARLKGTCSCWFSQRDALESGAGCARGFRTMMAEL